MNRQKTQNRLTAVLTAAVLVLAFFVSSLLTGNTVSVKAEKGPADGQHTAEITFVSKDKKDLSFIYLSGLVLKSDLKGISYDKNSNTLTLNNTNFSNEKQNYSLTIANMGEDFRLNIVGNCALDYLSLESIGYDTGCTITGFGTLDIGYLDISSDGKKMVATVDNTVNFNIDSEKMGYKNLPAVKVASKIPLTAMESMVVIKGATGDQLIYEESPSATSYAYETTTNKVRVTPTRVVKKGTDGKWGYYINNKLQTSYTGIAGNMNGLWSIRNGLVDFSYTGLEKGPNGWYMMRGGKADLTFNGLVPNENGNWFVQNGMVQFNYVGPVVINGQKYSVDKGKVK